MKCEICKTIERLGLEESAHDLWHCADGGAAKTALRRSRNYLRETGRQLQHFARLNIRFYRMWMQAHQRLVTLGL